MRCCEDPVSKEELEDVKATKVSLLLHALVANCPTKEHPVLESETVDAQLVAHD